MWARLSAICASYQNNFKPLNLVKSCGQIFNYFVIVLVFCVSIEVLVELQQYVLVHKIKFNINQLEEHLKLPSDKLMY